MNTSGEPQADTQDMAIINRHTNVRLITTDLCDRCGSQAYIRATMHGGGMVLLCAHHGREYMPKLQEIALVIDDYTGHLEHEEDARTALPV